MTSKYFILYLLAGAATIAHGQNTGIGVSNPLQKLHVAGNAFITDSLGIGAASPKARLDVAGTALLRSTNSNTPPAGGSGLDLFFGRAAGGNLPGGLSSGDIAFHYGGAGGGFRHFISSLHNAATASAGNALLFYINNSATAGGSSGPGAGNNLQLALTAKGVGIATASPEFNLDVNGNTLVRGNMGIGALTQVAKGKLDVYGNTLLRGLNNVAFSGVTYAALEFFSGKNATGGFPSGNIETYNDALAFNYGGCDNCPQPVAGGGYRHFITTRHQATNNISTGNSIDFYLNNSGAATGSVAAGFGNVLGIAVTANGLGVGTPTPGEKLEVAGNALVNGQLQVTDTALLAAIKEENVQTPVLQNNWVNNGSDFAPAGFWKDKEGMVHLQGLIKNGIITNGTLLFTLPAGYRPAARLMFTVDNGGNHCRVDVYTAGFVAVFTAGNNTWLNLSGISFRAL